MLVVDDNVQIRQLAHRILERAGYGVLMADDGQHAIETVNTAEDEVHLVLLDWNMPRISGGQTMIELRKLRPTVPVLFSTGSDGRSLIEELPNTERVDFIQKPYSARELVSKIQGMIGSAG